MTLDISILLRHLDNHLDLSFYPKIYGFSENLYECSACATLVTVDPYLRYTYDELCAMNRQQISMKVLHNKYPYSKEVEPNVWLTFCRKICEIKYNRHYEDDWEFVENK